MLKQKDMTSNNSFFQTKIDSKSTNLYGPFRDG